MTIKKNHVIVALVCSQSSVELGMTPMPDGRWQICSQSYDDEILMEGGVITEGPEPLIGLDHKALIDVLHEDRRRGPLEKSFDLEPLFDEPEGS